MEMFRRGAFPAASRSPSVHSSLCGSNSHRLGAVFVLLALFWAPAGWPQVGCHPGGPPCTASQVGTRGSPPALGLGRFNQNTCLSRALRLEACTPGRHNSSTLCSGPSVPMGPAGFFHRVIKHQSPIGRLWATPWTADKNCQRGGLCPRSGSSEAPHLPPAQGAASHADMTSLNHVF